MELDYSKLSFTIRPQEPMVLPPYKGSTLRGGFGYAFKRVVCALKTRECADCLLKEKCVYSYVFETPPPSNTKIMRKYKAAPHPFVIEPPPEKRRGFKPGDAISFGLVLIGRAVEYLPYFIYTFDELGRIGIGKGKTKFLLDNVKNGEEPIYDSASKTIKSFARQRLNLSCGRSQSEVQALRISFLTPTRIIYDHHLTLDLEFHMLIRSLVRRLSLLSYFHCGVDPSEVDFKGIIRKSENVKVIARDLRWYDWERYSARQDTRMKMGGFVGDITFEGDISPFMPFLRAGAVLHAGKGTTFGLGKYRIAKYC